VPPELELVYLLWIGCDITCLLFGRCVYTQRRYDDVALSAIKKSENIFDCSLLCDVTKQLCMQSAVSCDIEI